MFLLYVPEGVAWMQSFSIILFSPFIGISGDKLKH